MTFRRFLIRGFRQKCFVQKLWRKNYFFAALARSALRRVRVQSDLLDETAIEASVVVAYTKGSFHKKRCTYFAPSLYFLGKLTRPRPNVGRFTVRTPRNSDRTLATRTRTHAMSYTHAEAYALLCFFINHAGMDLQFRIFTLMRAYV